MQDREVIVGLGSKNPAKIRATREACERLFGNFKVVPIYVPGAPRQPMSDDEMIEGAILRAKYALTNTDADFGIGMEGGVMRNRFGVFVKGWVAVTDGEVVGLAATVSVQLPDYVWGILKRGEVELEEVMVKISGIPNIGKSIGAIGFFAMNHYDRVRAFRDATLCAFGRILRRKIFESPQ